MVQTNMRIRVSNLQEQENSINAYCVCNSSCKGAHHGYGRSIHIVLFVPKEKKSSSFSYCLDDDVVLRYSKNLVDMLLVPALIHIDCFCLNKVVIRPASQLYRI